MKNMFGIHRFTVAVGKNMSWHKKPPVLNKNFSRCKKLLVLFYHKMSRGGEICSCWGENIATARSVSDRRASISALVVASQCRTRFTSAR